MEGIKLENLFKWTIKYSRYEFFSHPSCLEYYEEDEYEPTHPSPAELTQAAVEHLVPVLKDAVTRALDTVRRHDVKVETEYVTIATRIEAKVDKVISDLQALSLLVKDKQGKGVNEELTGQAKYKPPACFFCLDESHKVSACPVRKFCIGCTSNLHPYDRCDFKDSTCDRCQMVGHDSKVHETTEISLRTELISLNPVAFNHFLAPVVSKGPKVGIHRGSRGRGTRGRGGRGRGYYPQWD